MEDANHLNVPGNYPDSAPRLSSNAAKSDCCASEALMMLNTTQASIAPTSPDNSRLSRKLMEDDSHLSRKLTDDSSCSSGELTEQNHLSRKLMKEHGAHNEDNYRQDLSIVKNKERLHPMSNALSWFDLSNK